MTITYNKQVLIKRGNTAFSSTYVGPISELTYDTGLNAIRVHDGVTPGGELMPTATQYADIIANVNPVVANISVIRSDISTLYANAAIQAGLIANIVIPPEYGNVNVESYLITNNYVTDSYVTSAIGNISIPPEYSNVNVESFLIANSYVTDAYVTSAIGNIASFTAGNWDSTQPTTISEAIDRLAVVVKALNGGTGA